MPTRSERAPSSPSSISRPPPSRRSSERLSRPFGGVFHSPVVSVPSATNGRRGHPQPASTADGAGSGGRQRPATLDPGDHDARRGAALDRGDDPPAVAATRHERPGAGPAGGRAGGPLPAPAAGLGPVGRQPAPALGLVHAGR